MVTFYVRDIRRALENGCWFAALALALTLPDVCGVVEYPGTTVAERYISWYDRYIAQPHALDATPEQTAYPSGEVIYNLRNTFLHQGKPSVIGEKVKEKRNRVDRFALMLGDGTMLHTMAATIDIGEAALRTLVVDVSWLCSILCDSAEAYYRDHGEAFDFGYTVLPQSALFGGKSPLDDIVVQGDPLGMRLQQKLDKAGSPLRLRDNVTQKIMEGLSRADWNADVEKTFPETEPPEAEASQGRRP